MKNRVTTRSAVPWIKNIQVFFYYHIKDITISLMVYLFLLIMFTKIFADKK